MPNFHDPKAADIVKQAEELIDNVRRQLQASDDFLRQQGLDPQKVRSVLQAQIGEKERAEAAALVKADLEAVEQEVAEEKARISFAQGATGAVKRRRQTV